MHDHKEWEQQAADALKSVARRMDIKAYVEQSPLLYGLLKKAALQYVTGESRINGLEAGQRLAAKGYAISLEYIGENTVNAGECEATVKEITALIDDLGKQGASARVSFDLSHIGLTLEPELAYTNLAKLAARALETELELFISMEESAKTEQILKVYKRAASRYPNIGITLQAHLHRTLDDLAALSASSGRIRIVKGAYQESGEVAISRSEALNERYLQLVEQALGDGHRVSVATHDEHIIEEAIQRGLLTVGGAKLEMLYGIRPELGSRLKSAGYPVQIYLTYGREWYLYLCHRIAEYPPNLYRAVAIIADSPRVDPVEAYD
ncbi:proline dehydrogenase family protein [Paenibacillus sp. FSL M7-0420]|uniref:proline dehydrogenase family protein n=1 Tax=Paenibacillus sp. FSL M7-0420 TaxID=2921609 RepID=UPI0030FB5546